MEKTIANTYKNAAIGTDEEIFESIHQKSKNIAIYQRDLSDLKEELSLLTNQKIEFRSNGGIYEITQTLKAFFGQNFPTSLALLSDIINLLELFERTTKAPTMRLLLATVESSMCRKFHTDVNDIRLLCTYYGPGTVWLPDEAVNYQALKARKSNEEIVRDQKHIQHVNTGDVVLLKGALYEDANPILHRSPSNETPGTNRLLLRIDTEAFLKVWA
ncbi:MAG: DUF1826 domain-containing protein [Bacteroidota bacterium]